MSIEQFTDEELLMELIKRNKPTETAKMTSYHTRHLTSIIGIGNDYFADIVLCKESMDNLADRLNKTRDLT